MAVDAPEAPPRRPRRRRPAPAAAPVWRFGFPAVLVALAVVALLLSASGARLVLDSRDGQVGRSQQDPTQPGYLETVAATPLLLVVHADDKTLYGAVVMTLGPEDKGGAAIFLTPDTIVREGEDGSLEDIYAQSGVDDATTGDGLRSAVSTMLGADIDATVTVDATSLAPLIEPVAPLRFEIAKAVKVTSKGKTTTVLPAGEAEISTADDIADAIETLGTGETPVDRTARQSAFWTKWVEAVRSKPDAATAGATKTQLNRFLTGLAAGTFAARDLPTVTFMGARVADTKALAAQLPTLVPYPRQQNVRLNTAVRNGVGDLSLNAPMEQLLVASGAQIASRGNADAFDVEKTSVVYHDQALQDRAQAIAAAIGATDVRYEERVDSEIQLTVTIGADFDPAKATTTTAAPTTTKPPSSTGAPR